MFRLSSRWDYEKRKCNVVEHDNGYNENEVIEESNENVADDDLNDIDGTMEDGWAHGGESIRACKIFILRTIKYIYY